MQTLHAAERLRTSWGGAFDEPVVGGAVLVTDGRITSVGQLAVLAEEFPGARVRRWPGVLGPGRLHEGPLPDAPSPRERVHAVLKSGATAVLAGFLDSPGLRSAADRNDLVVLSAATPPALGEGGRADLAVFDETGACVATVCAGRLVFRRR
ncbi:imidazolonepropionase-like domain-containing protein [Streptomyces sp. NPDC087425]|uniref:imidazolonepropionase-like domain-containing protein n=1 Tax=Streptomyces sp. NPDC087425 TaxID=3365787 RepID=UPI00382EC5CA